MTSELFYLAASGLLLLLLVVLQAVRNVVVLGLPKAAGNPEPMIWEGMNDRLNRAISNLAEGLVMLTPLVIAVSMGGLSNENTVLGAQLFFFARIVHALVYVIGIPYLRTGAWFVGIVGTLMLGYAVMA